MLSLSRRAGTAIGLAAALTIPLGQAAASAQTVRPFGVAYCTTSTGNGQAFAYCNVKSGQARVRADCVLAPDLYSPWVGTGQWNLWTGSCPWGIRGAIMEYR